MLFSSIIFLSLFLPVVILGYYIVPRKLRNLLLLLFSLLFYAIGEKHLVIVLIAVTLISFLSSLIIEKGYKKSGVFFSVIISLGVLFYFKYINFAHESASELFVFFGFDPLGSIPSVILPIGISFFTFQALSYTVDVYRGNVKASRNIIDYATYISFFPQLIAGPIVRYADISEQLRKRKITSEGFASGAERFILGLAKKVIIANQCAYIADMIFDVNPLYISPGAAWIGVLCYTMQIYFDFSGYSDMAIGLARMFGFRFLENFNYPYISRSIKDFWRRWHISLSSWFRDYLYIPLGGNRNGNMRTYLNLSVVFLATGLWHGASWNFVIWGIWHGGFIVIERVGFGNVLDKIYRPLQHIYTLFIVVIGWVFFRADNLTLAVSYLKKMFGISLGNDFAVIIPSYFYSIENITVFILALIFSIPVFPKLRKRLDLVFEKKNFISFFYYSGVLLILLFVMMKLSVDTYNPFIYFKF